MESFIHLCRPPRVSTERSDPKQAIWGCWIRHSGCFLFLYQDKVVNWCTGHQLFTCTFTAPLVPCHDLPSWELKWELIWVGVGSTIKGKHGPDVCLTCSELETWTPTTWLPCSCNTQGKPEPRVWVERFELLLPNSNWADTWHTRFQRRSRLHRASQLHEYKMRTRRDWRCFLSCSYITYSKVSLISIRNLAESLSIKQFNCIGFW